MAGVEAETVLLNEACDGDCVGGDGLCMGRAGGEAVVATGVLMTVKSDTVHMVSQDRHAVHMHTAVYVPGDAATGARGGSRTLVAVVVLGGAAGAGAGAGEGVAVNVGVGGAADAGAGAGVGTGAGGATDEPDAADTTCSMRRSERIAWLVG